MRHFAQDGSVDGTYTVKVSLVDKSGNILESEQTFVYDSQVPQLASISVNTEPSMELVPQEITEISESISRITLQFEEATRVDFTNTVLTWSARIIKRFRLIFPWMGLRNLPHVLLNLHKLGCTRSLSHHKT